MGGQAAPVVTEKVKKERKPRSADAKPNPWIDFTKSVRAALVAGGVEKLGAECQQFCKTLKSEQADYASWTPEAVQTRWRTWEKPAKAPTPPASDTEAPAAAAPSEKPKRVLTDEQKAKMKAGREAAKAKKAAEAASASGSASASEAPVAAEAAASDGEASTSSKKRGRPKGSKNKAPAESATTEEYKPLTLGGKKYLLSGDRAYERTDEGTAGTYAGVYDKKTKSITA
jgi:type IV secretory pathway VirB10-like protein